METKGKRAPRAAGPIATPIEAAVPAETPAEAAAPTASSEPMAAPVETLAEVVTPEPPPSVAVSVQAANSASPGEFAHFGREAFAALAASQAALARGLEALSAEMAGLARSGIDTTARTATEMLKVKTLSDAIEVNALFARNSLDALITGSARLSELGVKLAAETSQPILTQLGIGWIKAAHRSC